MEAISLIQLANADLHLSVIDIIEDGDLYTQYEFTIPVLKSSLTGAELNWPFSLDALRLFLSTNQ